MSQSSNIDVSSFNKGIMPNVDYRYANKGPQIKAVLAGAIGGYVTGTFIGWSSPVQPQLQRNSTELSEDELNSTWYINVDDNQMSWVGSLMTLGALVGSLGGGFLMDRFGRKITLMTISAPYLLAWLLIATAVNPGMLYAGRFVGGMAGGVSSVVSPIYISEVTTPALKGRLGILYSVLLVSGILVTSLFGWLNWRVISGISAVAPLIFFIAMFIVPESPYHLFKAGRKRNAQLALRWLRGPDYNIEPEMNQIETRLKIELASTFIVSDLLKPWALKPLLLAVSLMIFQQLSGINAAVFNAVAIFESAGSTLDTIVCAILLNLDQLVVVIVSSLLVDRLGRRTLFLISESIMCISLFALGAFFYVKEDPSSDPAFVASIGWLPLVSLITFIAAFGIGAGPIPCLLPGEILPAKVKGPCVSIVNFCNWLLAFVVTKTFVNLQTAITNAGAFWLFGSFCFLGVLFTLFILPETKGKTPEEIQAYFDKRKSLK